MILDKKIYLASRSPRRRELLAQIGVGFELLLLRDDPSRGNDLDESPLPGENPHDYVLRVSHAKAEAGWQRVQQRRLPHFPVLAADTAVVLNDRIMGKPANRDEAMEMLLALSGKRHEVLTAVAVANAGRIEQKLSATIVQFGKLTDHAVRRYAMTGESLDKAGAYAIQGHAAAFIEKIEGSYSGVMGLPLYETTELLAGFGIEVL
ncbi:MAG: septum formation inhibitor Maf [Gammaproteobacteria bacterium]|uniref:dTTP/UTP pyrophosphatase n=1 Tax=Sulfuricella denitrificans (strain DSM 22764 / NBRC 105220 / skB26) TaxID=1163617 RepID=S6A9D3_SULDS|nr:Maf family protein [Sulfuricella denitrificans]MBU1689629.1 septum formation inhibitor Maf [Gammaproteobacteria bacterium]MBU1978083.1 septum formation inhibitor Maf [Gammaproteobacteria bacterium]BAN33910.1 maf protein [Sulfuricella denitrificans skB26]